MFTQYELDEIMSDYVTHLSATVNSSSLIPDIIS